MANSLSEAALSAIAEDMAQLDDITQNLWVLKAEYMLRWDHISTSLLPTLIANRKYLDRIISAVEDARSDDIDRRLRGR